MLILTRKIGEAIILDGDIEITLNEVKVYREEKYERLPDYAAPPYG